MQIALRITTLLIALACSTLTLGQKESKKDTGPTNEELVQAWLSLSETDRADTIEWFVAECDRATHFRAELERFVYVRFEGDAFDWPAAEDPPVFDTAIHTPVRIIRRRFVDLTSSTHSAKVKALRGAWNEREMEVAFRYDWARQTIVQVQKWDDPERIARTAAAGFSPMSDLIEALVERQLDLGEMKDAAFAFGHAYSDRSGNAYRRVTLYDAWSSGQTIEMPDVECLGIVHTLDDDWKTWKAPVSKQDSLYKRIAEHFTPLRRYRALRTSLARCYLQGTPILPGGYEAAAVRLHGFWEVQVSDPEKMAEYLPEDKKWDAWWKKDGKKVDRSKDIRERALARIRALDESRAWTRRTFHGILKEYGAFGEGD
ncbi:hypothetical protein Poly30_27960 [Planctomycetes bacterium Poly30]|uniref:Uncharacterized protein n=1 Tax=Saltatorellus ferox TaxID=2528018 RepID=A0A518ET62_9BACT|nr:hypothetical protein Poly30_27960 [Planctomycetes bacterium Poly30]